MSNQTERIISMLIAFTVKALTIIVSLIVGWVACILIVPVVAKERGYDAFGGEWALVIAAAGITYWILSAVVKKIIGRG